MAEFELNPEILQTAAGSITGDIAQIQTAVYGREVRASIAECLYLLLQRCEQSETKISELENNFGILNETVKKLESIVESCKQSLEDYRQATDQRFETVENTLKTCVQDLNTEKSRTDIVIALLESELNKAAGYPDMDGDGRVNASDVSLVLAASAQSGSGGDSGLTEEQEKLADINGDGICNAEDAAIISDFSAALGVGLYQDNAIGWMQFKKDKGL